MYKYLNLAGILCLTSVVIFLIAKTKSISYRAMAITGIVLLVAMLLFDTYLTRLPIVLYNSKSILSVRIGTIPIEDFSYLFSVLLIVPAVFEVFYHDDN